MNSGTSNQQTSLNRLLRIILTAALVFAAWHVTSHEIDASEDANSHNECQVCRLSHVPIADLPTLTWFVPLLILSLILVVPVIQKPGQSFRYILGARAPPLF